jgi:nucleoside-diphosphate-sugar epimerase
MKIAVTGASGKIGSAVVRLARERGHQVVPIDIVGDGVEHLDVSDYDGLVTAFAGCDGVVHMAAIPRPGLAPDHVVHNTNVVGSYNVMRAAVENGIRRICQASSVNAIGHSFSRQPRYRYFPLDEDHPNACEDPYSLSKWICEEQGQAFARLYPELSIASLRFHLVVPTREDAMDWQKRTADPAKHLWAWTQLDAAADACLLSLVAPFTGHEVFYIVAPTILAETPSAELAHQHFPYVPLAETFSGRDSFFSSEKARAMLGWQHPG